MTTDALPSLALNYTFSAKYAKTIATNLTSHNFRMRSC